jgi:antitoxin PrlF
VTTFEAKVTSKGQITLPARLRDRLRIDAGDSVIFTEAADGTYRLHARNSTMADLKGLVRGDFQISGQDIAAWLEDARGARMLSLRGRRKPGSRGQ